VNKDVVKVEVLGVFPTDSQTHAVYVGNEDKCFVIHVEITVGRAIAMSLRGDRSERPLTHELIGLIFRAFDVKVLRVVINELRNNTYYARIILKAENEIHKLVTEIDARPSDCLAIALQGHAPMYVSQDVWEEADDRSDDLERIRKALEKEHKKLKSSEELEEDDDD
jgi:bifunctional DNase/RNase